MDKEPSTKPVAVGPLLVLQGVTSLWRPHLSQGLVLRTGALALLPGGTPLPTPRASPQPRPSPSALGLLSSGNSPLRLAWAALASAEWEAGAGLVLRPTAPPAPLEPARGRWVGAGGNVTCPCVSTEPEALGGPFLAASPPKEVAPGGTLFDQPPNQPVPFPEACAEMPGLVAPQPSSFQPLRSPHSSCFPSHHQSRRARVTPSPSARMLLSPALPACLHGALHFPGPAHAARPDGSACDILPRMPLLALWLATCHGFLCAVPSPYSLQAPGHLHCPSPAPAPAWRVPRGIPLSEHCEERASP